MFVTKEQLDPGKAAIYQSSSSAYPFPHRDGEREVYQAAIVTRPTLCRRKEHDSTNVYTFEKERKGDKAMFVETCSWHPIVSRTIYNIEVSVASFQC
jgi:hypothetical protein